LTHRTCDYHADHRIAGQAVQDAAYMVTVPGVLPDIPALRRDPVIAYLPDLFRKPYPLSPDVVIDVTDHVDTIVRMLACQRSQVFEWLPFEEGILDQVPAEEPEKVVWLKQWYAQHVRPRADRFREALVARYGRQRGQELEFVEVFEISEYGRQMDDMLRSSLFPGAA
jgi:N-acetylglucosamine malate deacetylase 1